jgi:hypothetical protein
LVPHLLSLLGHTHSKWAGLSYISTKLVYSPQELNHYIKANIRNLWGQVVLCRKVRTNLSNLDQIDWALETDRSLSLIDIEGYKYVIKVNAAI